MGSSGCVVGGGSGSRRVGDSVIGEAGGVVGAGKELGGGFFLYGLCMS